MRGAWEESNLPGLDVPRRQAQLGLGNGTKPGAWEPKLQPGLFGHEGTRAAALCLPETVPWVRYDSTRHRGVGPESTSAWSSTSVTADCLSATIARGVTAPR